MTQRTNPTHSFKDSVKHNSFEVIDCLSCGFWHVYPIPDRETLDRYYQELYYQDSQQHGDMKDKNEDPDGYYRLKYADKLTNFERLLSVKDKKSILDLGAGFGDYLSFMKEQGWSVAGVEPSDYCLKTSRHQDCNIHLGSLEDLATLKLGRFSVITLNTVLEHYPYPEELLVYIRDHLMDEKTILHIEVPNDFSLMQEAMLAICNPRKYWVCPPGHLNYWTHENLMKFVTRLGFGVELCESTFPLELMALLGEDYVTYPERGRGMHLKRVELEKKFDQAGKKDLKLKIYQEFAKIGIGREILLYLRKKKPMSLEKDREFRTRA